MNSEELLSLLNSELAPVKTLKAGELSCIYEEGNLRLIKSGDFEIVRMIYSAVRDENWKTIAPVIEGEKIEETGDSFSISYTAVYRTDNISYKSKIRITGTKDNTISFSFSGEALSAFKRNRIGLCVHHPIKECAGKEIEIFTPEGSTYNSVFPELISPHQPFKDIKEMVWEVGRNAKAKLIFKGDIFETEDQRNWTDASYKTYSTPLQIPFPVQVVAGENVEQKITLQLLGEVAEATQVNKIKKEAATISLLPKIGYCRSKNGDKLAEKQTALLNAIPFHHYRVELKLQEPNWKNEFKIAGEEAICLNTALELVLFFDSGNSLEIKEVIDALKETQAVLGSILVLQRDQKTTPPDLISIAYPVLKEAFPRTKIGYGTDAFFTELNRNLPAIDAYDFVSFSFNPQVHAVDTRSLVENLEAQSYTIQTLRALLPAEREIHVSPITFKMRYNPDSTNPKAAGTQERDPRQQTPFGAAWTLQTLKNLSGANQVTLFELSGPNGILDEEKETSVYSMLKQLKMESFYIS